MKIRAVIGAILILSAVFAGIYSYLQLANREKGADTDLFSLVPENSLAILETNNVSELMENIGGVSFAGEYDSLHISDLLGFLKNNIDLLKANTAHGLSSQMNQMLLSFHEDGGPRDQVLYGKLGTGDEELIENLIRRISNPRFPARTIDYQGEEIRIYPLGKEEFLACYFQPGFYAVSFRKKRIEEVIDAYKHKKSILNDEIFTRFLREEKSFSSASLYIKAQNIPVGSDNGNKYGSFHLSRWTAFKINMKGNALYLTGNCIDTDTCNSFENRLKNQHPIEIYPAGNLPVSTSFFYQLAISDFSDSYPVSRCRKSPASPDDVPAENDSLFFSFLADNAGEELRFIIFHDDRQPTTLRKVMNIELKNEMIAEEKLKTILRDIRTSTKRKTKSTWINGRSFKTYQIPENTVFSRFSSNPVYRSQTYGCFYNGNLLVSPSDSCIFSYIRQIESGKTLAGDAFHEKCISTLSSQSAYLSITDMEDAVLHPEIYGQLMPRFFIDHKEFFRHFLLTIQFTTANGNAYPYIVLLHKEGNNM